MVISNCIRFTQQDFGSGVAVGVASVRRHQKLPPCQTEPVSASSKTDSLLAKAAAEVVPLKKNFLKRVKNAMQQL